MIITNGKATKIKQEKGRRELKRGKRMKNN